MTTKKRKLYIESEYAMNRVLEAEKELKAGNPNAASTHYIAAVGILAAAIHSNSYKKEVRLCRHCGKEL